MAMIKVKSKGDYAKIKHYLSKAYGISWKTKLDQYGREGVEALKNATPYDTGETAGSWRYEIVEDNNGIGIQWINDNVTETGVPIVILLQYGHATSSGKYYQGTEFINSSLKPVFDRIEKEIEREVRSIGQ